MFISKERSLFLLPIRKAALKPCFKLRKGDFAVGAFVALCHRLIFPLFEIRLLTADAIYAILSEEKPNQKEQIKLPRDELRKYFPQNYSDEQIKRDILKGLELLKRQRERNRDAR